MATIRHIDYRVNEVIDVYADDTEATVRFDGVSLTMPLLALKHLVKDGVKAMQDHSWRQIINDAKKMQSDIRGSALEGEE